MCGIVGALAFGKLSKKDEKIRQRLMRYLTSELMLETEERGKDATGAAILFNDGNYLGIKRGEESSKFLAKFGKGKDYYGSLLEVWRQHDEPVRAFIGHCRKGTTGAKEDNENNHPIKIRNIVGVHNGVIRNDYEIEKNLGCKRDGRVDSEMIFRLFDHFTNSGKEPFTMDMLESIIARLTGAFAVIAFNSDNLNQIPVFRDGRPLEMILIKDLSLLFIVSELKFWSRAHFRYERMVSYAEVKMPSLLDMDIDKEVFKDDSAAIFDLTVHCTEDTKIEDLGEFRKIPRNNKIWTTQAALNGTNYGTGSTHSYNNGQKMAESAKNKKDDKSKSTNDKDTDADDKTTTSDSEDTDTSAHRKRVFNNITKKYETQPVPNPKKLDKDESKVIPIENVGDVSKTEDESTETKSENTKNSSIKTKVTFEEDSPGQAVSDSKLDLEDHTDYTLEEDDKKDIIDAEIIEVKEVDMTVEDPEVLAVAQSAYKEIPGKDRGYDDIETLLNDINIKDEKTADNLGLKLVANRVAKVQWTRGFIFGWKHGSKKVSIDEEKTKLREKHIAGLKSLVVILSQFFTKTKSEGCRKARKSEESLRAIANDHISKRRGFDMEKLSSVFNDHESGKIREARDVISDVERSMKTGDGNK
jgi:hypothetical protein